MKSWETLDADKVKIINIHYTPGRSGNSVRYIVLHHNGGNLTTEGCYDVWQTREASAHYQVECDGTIGQLVWDKDTAWHAGNWNANVQSIGIEHADDSTSPWHISDATLDNGAHLVAALCKYYKLGRPQWGVNVFPHNHFSATACPASIAGNQRDAYMAKAQAYYDSMTGSKPAPTPAKPAPAPAASIDAGSYTVVVDQLHVRSGASTSAAVIATYTRNQIVNLDGWMTVADGYKWGRYTAYSGAIRYIALGTADGSQTYLSMGSAPSVANTVSAGTYRVAVEALNVRSAQSLSASIVATYSAGQIVNLDGWSEIHDGYLWGRYTAYSGAIRYIAVGPADGSSRYLNKI